MRYVMTVILCLLLFTAPVFAAAPDEARELLKTKIDAVLVLLQDKSMDKAVDKVRRNEWVTEVVTPIFAYKTMAKLSLGKKHWSALNREERETFSALFIDRLQQSYLDKLDLYSGEKVHYGKPQASGKKVHIQTTLQSNDNRIEMLYKMYRSAQGWKIYDVEIEGVSVIQTYRTQFGEVLSTGTFEDLLAKLKNGNLEMTADETNSERSKEN